MDPRGQFLEELLSRYAPLDDRERADVQRTRAENRRIDLFGRGSSLHVTGSALVVAEEATRVLLRWHDRLERWLQVGGHMDVGEKDPAVTASREAREETGLNDLRFWPSSIPILIHVVIVSVPARADEPAHEHVDLRYVLCTDAPHLATQERDSTPLQWLGFDEAISSIDEENLKDSLQRVVARRA